MANDALIWQVGDRLAELKVPPHEKEVQDMLIPFVTDSYILVIVDSDNGRESLMVTLPPTARLRLTFS